MALGSRGGTFLPQRSGTRPTSLPRQVMTASPTSAPKGASAKVYGKLAFTVTVSSAEVGQRKLAPARRGMSWPSAQA